MNTVLVEQVRGMVSNSKRANGPHAWTHVLARLEDDANEANELLLVARELFAKDRVEIIAKEREQISKEIEILQKKDAELAEEIEGLHGIAYPKDEANDAQE
jgi:hypothetical protein